MEGNLTMAINTSHTTCLHCGGICVKQGSESRWVNAL